MSAKAIYEVHFPDFIELFAESASGGFDFDSRIDGPDGESRAARRSAELLGGDRPEIELFSPAWSHPVYEIPEINPASRRVCRRGGPGSVPVAILGFFLRYPALRAAVRSGELGAAGEALSRSEKLSVFAPFIGWHFSSSLFPALAVHWLMLFDADKEVILDRLLKGLPLCSSADSRSRWERGFSYIRDSVKEKEVGAFREKASSLLCDHLVEKQLPLILPVVGSDFRPALGNLYDLLDRVRNESRYRSLAEGTESALPRIDAYVQSLEILVVPEPYNKHDPHALAILMREPRGPLERIGYLRREIAAALSPIVRSGAVFSARFARIHGAGADIEMHAECI